jgi:TetR/AcrR family transcriptional regulator, transcriptional repressor for nem operon
MARRKGFDEGQALDACVETFRSGSYAGTSTEDLCQATGLSRSSLYNTFTCKADLYRRSLERYAESKDEERDAYATREGSGRDLLCALLTDVLAEQRADADRRGCLVVSAAVEVGSSDEAVAGLVRGNLTAFRELLAELVARGQDDGSIACGRSAAELATVIHATLNGLQVAGRVDAVDDSSGARAVDTLMSLL